MHFERVDQMDILRSERLELRSLSAAFLGASLAGDVQAANRMLGVPVSPDWFQERLLMQRRLAQLRHDPPLQPWLLRAIVLCEEQVMVGRIGFHAGPGAADLQDFAPQGVELGYKVYPPFQRRGYATEACAILMSWATQMQPGIPFVVSISPDNVPSLRIARHFGFQKVGTRLDEIDGPEDVFVRRVAEA